ncbi:DUF418 domain-containing protein [Bacillus sp. FJAT-42376]|uniref:DUF418 domain-containing protein n=1 Tax=Bacillus sp. FJAT-42376 TaxID=2014076 RepID=UPI0013DE2CFC|nr:DUF418 domain-containing protein [Bacillus sp. FJAT-42376]
MKNIQASFISAEERLQSLDVLRGFALFGILMVNLFDFSGPQLYKNTLIHSSGWADRTVEILVFVLAQASFYPLFSFLFGAGGVMFYKRLEEKGQSPERFFTRRMLGLLIIGVFHAFFIWHGDILITYALIGFLFMLFIRMPARALAVWSCSLIAIPNMIIALLLLGIGNLPAEEINTENILSVYQKGNFSEIMSQRAADWFYVNNPVNAPFLILSILPMFLLGAYAMKRRWFERDPSKEMVKTWAIAAAASGLTGFFIKIMPVIHPESALWSYLHQSLGGPLAAMFYLTGILLCIHIIRVPGVYRVLACAGRASMTNYLLQSIVCTFIFYSYGIGLYGRTASLQTVLIGIGVYLAILTASWFWFKRYKQGPVEKCWRWFVYWRP